MNGFGMAALKSQKEVIPPANAVSSVKDHGLFDFHAAPSRLTSLPASTFLVPGIIEALSNSSYAPITEVVPGEADIFCAQYAKDHGGVILTGDSDLLVHDLGPNGSVVLFRDIGFSDLDGSSLGEDEHALVGFEYKPMEIATGLGLESLLGLAYCMTQDGSEGFTRCLQKVRSGSVGTDADPAYREFCQQYLFSPRSLALLRSEKEMLSREALETILRRSDPRISEFIHLFAFPEDARGTDEVEVFLPFLIDDPSRASAWKVGLFVRQMAYSIANIFVPDDVHAHTSVKEWSRRGVEVCPLQTALLSLEELSQACESFLFLMNRISSEQPQLSTADTWKLYGAYEVCRWHAQEGKAVPSSFDLEQVVTGRLRSTTLSWSVVHLFAQLHAALYSVRMLQQVLEVSTKLIIAREYPSSSTLDMLSALNSLLAGLPGIHELFSYQLRLANEAQEEQSSDSWSKALTFIFELSEGEELDMEMTGEVAPTEVDTSAKKGKRSKKRQKGRRKSNRKISRPGTSSKNPYANLGEG
ncbi:hypothetical protein L228DRAFT_248947 [Xylona heveae TC161]|uniref:Asteroid domain-containing protein n=1 Tax=Xylona heveae (strain CBS 132557 / TC161) TaxID=1328760 RepID=A0A165FMZ5_XYLHT|nr:hypothetical protein L228DRAFT_248947 [Xylona heveae TC161]KZF21174.1 hypothetical protein L228DRAFT_248947 [Xylona heveae TC161]